MFNTEYTNQYTHDQISKNIVILSNSGISDILCFYLVTREHFLVIFRIYKCLEQIYNYDLLIWMATACKSSGLMNRLRNNP